MPVRTAYAGAAVAGEVLSAANVNRISGGWIGYNEVTANQTPITTEVDLTGLSVAVTVGTARRIRISVHVLATFSPVSVPVPVPVSASIPVKSSIVAAVTMPL